MYHLTVHYTLYMIIFTFFIDHHYHGFAVLNSVLQLLHSSLLCFIIGDLWNKGCQRIMFMSQMCQLF